MNATNLTAEVRFRVEFYDVDSMNVVWHGNYVKYLELGRCALLDSLGYGYREMHDSGYAWPVVDMRIKYIKPLVFGQEAVIRASLAEYENRLKIRYEIFDADGERVTRAESTQMAVDMATGESVFESPRVLTAKVESRGKGETG